MTRDYSGPGDPYGISEYTAQSADTELQRTAPATPISSDLRGNTLTKPRSIPTQEEADAIKGAA